MKKLFLLTAALFLMAVSAFAQEREISGTVIDGDTKEPAINVTVRLLKPDSTFVTEDGWRPGGGVMVNCVETCTGVKPFVIGKPNTVMIEMVCDAYGLKPEEILAVGDRFETDILGGINFGALTALVLTGYETPETVRKLDQKPDLICADLAEVIETLTSL